jgi:hypothetical protein
MVHTVRRQQAGLDQSYEEAPTRIARTHEKLPSLNSTSSSLAQKFKPDE